MEKGMEKGMKKGIEIEKRETVLRMKNIFTPEQIAVAVGLSVKAVKDILGGSEVMSAN